MASISLATLSGALGLPIEGTQQNSPSVEKWPKPAILRTLAGQASVWLRRSRKECFRSAIQRQRPAAGRFESFRMKRSFIHSQGFSDASF